MSASSEFCWTGLRGLRVDLDNSELGLAANFAGVFLFFSVWPVLPNENQGGAARVGPPVQP